MIKLNGLVIVNNDEMYFQDFTIETDEELDLPFDYLTDEEEDYYDCDCDDCDCYDDDEDEIEFDLDDDERFDNYTDDFKSFLSKYVRKVYDTDFCPYCIADIFSSFYDDEL